MVREDLWEDLWRPCRARLPEGRAGLGRTGRGIPFPIDREAGGGGMALLRAACCPGRASTLAAQGKTEVGPVGETASTSPALLLLLHPYSLLWVLRLLASPHWHRPAHTSWSGRYAHVHKSTWKKGVGKGPLPGPLALPPARAHTGHAVPTLCQHLLSKSVPDDGGMLGHTELPVLAVRDACRGGAHAAGVKAASLGEG